MEVVWLLTALTILVTICIGVFKGILGDNIQYGRGPREFLLDRLARYGDPFTMSLMGKTYTVISSPEIIKFVLSTAHASFPTAFPVQYARLFNPEEFSSKKRSTVRKLVLTASSGDELQKLVPYISSLAEKTIKSWEHQAVVNSVEELQKVCSVVERFLQRLRDFTALDFIIRSCAQIPPSLFNVCIKRYFVSCGFTAKLVIKDIGKPEQDGRLHPLAFISILELQ